MEIDLAAINREKLIQIGQRRLALHPPFNFEEVHGGLLKFSFRFTTPEGIEIRIWLIIASRKSTKEPAWFKGEEEKKPYAEVHWAVRKSQFSTKANWYPLYGSIEDRLPDEVADPLRAAAGPEVLARSETLYAEMIDILFGAPPPEEEMHTMTGWNEARQKQSPAEKAYKYCIYKLNGRRSPKYEPVILQDPKYAARYAELVLQKRWPEAEPAIAEDPVAGVRYCEVLIKKRWPKLEKRLLDPKKLWAGSTAVAYAEKIIKGRWPELENFPFFLQDLYCCYRYAVDVLHGRFRPGEAIIIGSSYITSKYVEALFHIPEIEAAKALRSPEFAAKGFDMFETPPEEEMHTMTGWNESAEEEEVLWTKLDQALAPLGFANGWGRRNSWYKEIRFQIKRRHSWAPEGQKPGSYLTSESLYLTFDFTNYFRGKGEREMSVELRGINKRGNIGFEFGTGKVWLHEIPFDRSRIDDFDYFCRIAAQTSGTSAVEDLKKLCASLPRYYKVAYQEVKALYEAAMGKILAVINPVVPEEEMHTMTGWNEARRRSSSRIHPFADDNWDKVVFRFDRPITGTVETKVPEIGPLRLQEFKLVVKGPGVLRKEQNPTLENVWVVTGFEFQWAKRKYSLVSIGGALNDFEKTNWQIMPYWNNEKGQGFVAFYEKDWTWDRIEHDVCTEIVRLLDEQLREHLSAIFQGLRGASPEISNLIAPPPEEEMHTITGWNEAKIIGDDESLICRLEKADSEKPFSMWTNTDKYVPIASEEDRELLYGVEEAVEPFLAIGRLMETVRRDREINPLLLKPA